MKFEASRELTTYFKELEGKTQPLTKEEESVLIPLAKEGNHKAVTRIVESCTLYVVKMANKYMGQGMSVMDLVREGNMGTMEAIKRYKKKEKTRFITYAALWIRKYINDSVATKGRIVRIPMHHEFDIFKAKKAGEESSLSPNTVRIDAKLPHAKQSGQSSSATIGDILLKVNPSVEEDHNEEAKQLKVDNYLNKISSGRDREILKAYFGIGRSYALAGKELSNEFGLSQVRISQIVHKTLDALRK